MQIIPLGNNWEYGLFLLAIQKKMNALFKQMDKPTKAG